MSKNFVACRFTCPENMSAKEVEDQLQSLFNSESFVIDKVTVLDNTA